jgi:hypothetical protein
LVEEHPAFQGVPEAIKSQLVEMPAGDVIPQSKKAKAIEIKRDAGPSFLGT